MYKLLSFAHFVRSAHDFHIFDKNCAISNLFCSHQSRAKGGATGISALGAVGNWGANTFVINLVLC
jgi:hypothetical protein